MPEIPSKLSSALSTEWLKARSVAKRMSKNFDGISDLRDLIYQLKIKRIRKP